MNWTVSFVEPTMDKWGGPQYSRTQAGVTAYPKLTRDAAALIQAVVDVWIDIGWPGYWDDASRLYNWMTGSNELSLDLQQAYSVQGGIGGFYEGIQENGPITDSNLATTALALYAMSRATYIQIAEFPLPIQGIILIFSLGVVAVGVSCSRKRSAHATRTARGCEFAA